MNIRDTSWGIKHLIPKQHLLKLDKPIEHNIQLYFNNKFINVNIRTTFATKNERDDQIYFDHHVTVRFSEGMKRSVAI